MNKETFLRELRAALAGMPPDEIANAIEYYEEYFAEAGPEQEAKLVQELGSPKAVAAQLRVDVTLRDMEGPAIPSAKKGISAVWLVILSIFAAPIALPMALAAVTVAAALVSAVLAVVLSIFATAVALLVGGVFCVAGSLPMFAVSIASGFLGAGVGLALTGISLLMIVVMVLCARLGFRGVAYLMNRVGGKKRGKEA